MPNKTPGQVAYAAYSAATTLEPVAALGIWITPALLPWAQLRAADQHCWEAAAQAVLTEVHAACPCFRYAIGDVVRVAGSPCRWEVRLRRWFEREVMPPYAEYGLVSPEGLMVWEVEADVVLWEDTAHA